MRPPASQGFNPIAAPTFAWTFTDDWLLVSGSMELLKQTLRRLTGEDKRNFAASEAFKKTRARFPGPSSGLSYVDMARQITSICTQLQMVLPMASLISRGKVSANVLDFAAKPDQGTFARYLGPAMTRMTDTPDGFAFESAWLNP